MSIDAGQSEPVKRVVEMLVEGGFVEWDGPLAIAGIPFRFSAALVKPGTLELVVVADVAASSGDVLLENQLDGLARALDLLRSRRSITVVPVGPQPDSDTMNALAQVARVLAIGTPIGVDADEQLRDALAVLLPLRIATEDDGRQTWDEIVEELLQVPDASLVDLDALIDASAAGADEVESVLKGLLNATLET